MHYTLSPKILFISTIVCAVAWYACKSYNLLSISHGNDEIVVTDSKEEYMRLLLEGNRLYSLGSDHYNESIVFYRNAIQVGNNDYIHTSYNNLGNVLREIGNYNESIQMLSKAISLHSGSNKYHYNLGVSYHMNQVYDDAIESYQKSIKLDSRYIKAHYNIGIAYQEIGRLYDALASYMSAMKLDSYHIDSRINYCNILLALSGQVETVDSFDSKVEVCYKQVLTIEPSNVKGIVNLASYYQHHKSSGAAIAMETIIHMYEHALALDPTNRMARNALNAISSDSNDELEKEYIAELFDSYSFTFEQSLMNLNYTSHIVVGNTISQHSTHLKSCVLPHKECSATSVCKKNVLKVLDLGCGTGLACMEIRESINASLSSPHTVNDNISIHVAGIDLSNNMLYHARQKNCYNETITGDIVEYLSSYNSNIDDSRLFHIATSADVMVYFGNLEQVLMQVHRSLAKGGLFIFTVEALVNTPSDTINSAGDTSAEYLLQDSGRFAHTRDYIQMVASRSKYEILSIESFTPRYNKGVGISGFIICLKSL